MFAKIKHKKRLKVIITHIYMLALVLNVEDISIDSFHFLDSKNNLIMEGVFTKLIYTLPTFSINSIYIYFPIKNNYSMKNMIIFDVIGDKDILDNFRNLEIELLYKYSTTQMINKKPNYSISNMFSYGKCKFFGVENSNRYLIKISGIWESDSEYGVTYKIVNSTKL